MALARAARAALAAVPDAEAPATIGAAAIAQANRSSKTSSPAWYRWGAAAAGIAAVIVALALLLPNVGSNGTTEGGRPASAESGAGAPAAPTPVGPATGIERQDTDYDAMSVAELARSYAGKSVAVTLTGSTDGQFGFDRSSAFGSAATCLQRAAGGDEGTLIHLVDARFHGTPAYLGVYLTGPGAGQPADAVRVLVVPHGDCARVLSSAWAKL